MESCHTKRFSGLISRWTIPLEWRKERAEAMSFVMHALSLSENLTDTAIVSNKSPPCTHKLNIHLCPFLEWGMCYSYCHHTHKIPSIHIIIFQVWNETHGNKLHDNIELCCIIILFVEKNNIGMNHTLENRDFMVRRSISSRLVLVNYFQSILLIIYTMRTFSHLKINTKCNLRNKRSVIHVLAVSNWNLLI